MGDASATTLLLPAGFPACRSCPYAGRNDPGVCLACCAGCLSTPQGRRCPICHQPLESDRPCTNDWCTRADRWFSTSWAIGPHTGAWRWAIAHYKYRAATAWAEVFGRVLLGYLDQHLRTFERFDLIVPMPSYCGPGARRDWDHVAAVVAVSARLGGERWPFATGLVTKVAETPALTGRPRSARRTYAEGPLRRALRVPDAGPAGGRRVLVVDDVFTEGSTLREVARILRRAGSTEVAGLALARQPWQPIRTRSRQR